MFCGVLFYVDEVAAYEKRVSERELAGEKS